MRGRSRWVGGFFWYRIESARMPRMALAQAPRSQHAALCRAVFTNRLGGVIRAAWVKTAILPENRADAQLICAQQQ